MRKTGGEQAETTRLSHVDMRKFMLMSHLRGQARSAGRTRGTDHPAEAPAPAAQLRPWYYHPFLVAFGAVLPLTVINMLATATASFLAKHRAKRLMQPNPRATFLLMALGWALAGVACALLAWAAGARSTGPGVGEDWIATGLVWATMISACATLMMLGQALTAGTAKSPAGS